jgi:hypothetical protein
VKFAWDQSTNQFVPTLDAWPASQQNACTTAAGGPPNRIGVYAKVRHNAMTGSIPSTTITEASAMFLEPFPALAGCKP